MKATEQMFQLSTFKMLMSAAVVEQIAGQILPQG